MNALLALANKTEVARRLRKKGYADSERTLLRRLSKREELEPRMVRDIEEMFDLAGREEAAPPEWVERLLAGVMALEESGQISEDTLARAQAKAAAYLAVTPRERPRQEGGGDGVASSS